MQSTKPKIESYPAPTHLATETDLSPQEVKAITEAVNPLIADAFALYVKTKKLSLTSLWFPFQHAIR
jgi:starvation-inducible DNA-binding protein